MEMTKLILLTILLCAILSCKNEEDAQPTGPGENPTENVIGTVTDLSGTPLANVQMHLVYRVDDISTIPLDDSQNPTLAVFYTEQMLTTECDGDIPLADGTPVYVMWDADNDGQPSAGDRLPTVCANPPDDCGFQTVNYNQFSINGVEMELGPGRFVTDPAFSTYGEHLEPSRFYLEVRCSDGNVLWRSEMVEVPDGLSDQPLTEFACTQCEGAPIGETTMGHIYPNPIPSSDDATLPFTLRDHGTVTIQTRSLSTGIVTTHFQDTLAPGAHEQFVDHFSLPNGMYVYTMSASAFFGRDTLLKNISSAETLRGTSALTTTDGEGNFALNAPFGMTITGRTLSNNPIGESLPLDSVRVVAILNGYLPADTMISLASASQHTLSLRLRPE